MSHPFAYVASQHIPNALAFAARRSGKTVRFPLEVHSPRSFPHVCLYPWSRLPALPPRQVSFHAQGHRRHPWSPVFVDWSDQHHQWQDQCDRWHPAPLPISLPVPPAFWRQGRRKQFEAAVYLFVFPALQSASERYFPFPIPAPYDRAHRLQPAVHCVVLILPAQTSACDQVCWCRCSSSSASFGPTLPAI